MKPNAFARADRTLGDHAEQVVVIAIDAVVEALCEAGRLRFIGAFNLVRAASYRQSGGYEALWLIVVDDVKLSLLLRRAGRRTRAFIGGNDVECHWGTTAWGTVKIMEKNYFAAVDYRVGLVLAGSVFVIFVSTILVFGLLSGTAAGLAADTDSASSDSGTTLGLVMACRDSRAVHVSAVPLAVLNSTFVTLRQGGVRWRETFYPLNTLRTGNVR